MDETTTDQPLSFLNMYELDDEGKSRHVVAFLDPVLAGSVGIFSGCFVGDFTPDAEGEFDVETFVPNPEFIQSFTAFMNNQAMVSPDLQAGALQVPNLALGVIDPRGQLGPDEDPESEEVLGHFMVDEYGIIVPGSFEYNPEHLWFNPQSGVSALLENRDFYEFLHPEAKRQSS